MEKKPAKVEEISKQAGETQKQWEWVEPSVWTNRMLEALEKGVKGGVWYSLIDKLWKPENLEASFKKVKANKGSSGVDGTTISKFERKLKQELERLEKQLKQETYKPQPIRRAWIPKGDGKSRPLGIPTTRDRLVQTALRNVIEPIFEKDFATHSYGFRPGKNAKDALRRVDKLLKDGYRYVVDADIQGYFDNIPKIKLMEHIKSKIADSQILNLINSFLEQPVQDSAEEITPEKGTPQGAVISPLLANIYLNPLDKLMANKGFEMTRYADDLVILCKSASDAEIALSVLKSWMNDAELSLHPEKTRLVDMTIDGNLFEFLGYKFSRMKGRDYKFPRKKSLTKFKDAIRQYTRRANGYSMDYIIAKLNPILRGWFNYFKHSHYTIFKQFDGWIRMRLRSILRKRRGGRGCGRGRDHQRYPNKFFSDLGLFFLETAYVQNIQSIYGKLSTGEPDAGDPPVRFGGRGN